MKKSLLTLVSVMLTTASALAAGWVEPIPEFTAPTIDGTPQFLYNTGAKGFFCGGNDHNTRASISTSMGDSIYFQPVTDAEGSYYFRCYPSVAKKGNFFFVSANGWDASWVDAPNDGKFHETLDETDAYPGVDKWALAPQGNNIYKIYNTTELGQIPEFDPVEGVGYYGIAEYFKGEGNNTRTYFYDPSQTYTYVDEQEEEQTGDVFTGSFYDEWRFVSQEAYGVWAAKKAIFDAAVALGKTLDDAATECPGLDVSAIQAVFDNPNSTEAELKQANEDLKVLMVNYKLKDATVENPANISEKIVNRTFDVIGDFTGWSEGFGAGGDKAPCAEVWRSAFDVHQDIAGLPEGIYMVACNGYSRYNDNHNEDYVRWKSGAKSDTKIYLQSETRGQFFTPVMFVSQGGSVDKKIGGKDQTEYKYEEEGIQHTLYCPNSMAAAVDYFHDGTNRYRNEAYGPLAAGETLRIGVSNPIQMYWSIFDDFELMYFGNGLDAYQHWGLQVKNANQISFDGYYYGAPEKQYYDHVMSQVTTATTKEAISEAIKLVDVAVDTVNASRQAYEAYVAAIAAAETWLNEAGIFEGDDNYNKLSDYVSAPAEDNEEVTEAHGYPNGCANYILNLAEGEFVGKLNVKDIIAETEYLQTMHADAVRSNLVDGSDLTDLIVNPGFEEAGGKGWSLDTHNGAATSSLTNWHGGNSTNYGAEAYQQKFDVYQIIENVPNGLYEVSVQAFFRTGPNPTAYEAYTKDPTMEGDAKVYSYVYFNSFANPVRNVMEIQFEDKELDPNNTNTYKTDAGTYTLDGMTSASNAFSLPNEERNFTMKVYGLVTDGKIRLGIRNLDTNADYTWTLWDNFKLVYRAKNADAIAAVLEAKYDEYSTYVDEQKDNELINSNEQDLAGDAIENAETALGSGDADKMWDALIAINDAYTHTQEHVAIMTETRDVMDELSNAINEYSETASAAAVTKANEILGTDYDDLTNEELSTLSASAKDAIAELKIPATEGASDKEPVDMTKTIINPGFEEGFNTGWKNTHNGGNAQILSSGIEGQSAEFWNGTAANLKFNIWQDIAHLPAGKYELTADASNCLAGNSTNNPDALGRAFLYAGTFTSESDTTYFSSDPVVFQEEQCTEKWNNYSVIFTVNEGETVAIGFQTSGTMAAGWFVCDNFTLKYFGTASQHEDSENPMSVDGIEVAEGAQIVAIYTVSGAPVASLQKGLNIVKYADGSVKKIFVK